MFVTVLVYGALLAVAFGLAFWAFRARDDRSALVGLYLLFGFPGGLLSLAGLALIVRGNDLGPVLLPVGIGMAAPLLKPFRVGLAKVIPIDSSSAVDMTGLCLLLPMLGSLFVSGVMNSSPPDAGELSGVSSFDLITQAVFLVGLAYVAVGWRVVRRFVDATYRLGFHAPTWRMAAASIGGLVAALIVYGAIAAVAQATEPELFDDLEQVTDDMTRGNQNVAGAALIGLSAGIGEEAMFRGAMQPRFGIALTSIAFALFHAPQYGLSLIILALFAVSVVLGLERKYFGTTASMVTHALYNFMAVVAQMTQ